MWEFRGSGVQGLGVYGLGVRVFRVRGVGFTASLQAVGF